MGILSVSFNNINLDNNFDADCPGSIILVRLLVWQSKFKKCKALKKYINDELMSIVWHPKIWRYFCMTEDEKKEIEPIFTD